MGYEDKRSKYYYEDTDILINNCNENILLQKYKKKRKLLDSLR